MLATSSNGPDDPSFRVRIRLPGAALLAHGIALDEMPLFSAAEARRFRQGSLAVKPLILAGARVRLRRRLGGGNAARWKTVVVQRGVDLLPFLRLERLAAAKRRLIFDIDDAVWLGGRQTGGHPLSVFKGTVKRVAWLAAHADHIMAGNEIIADYLRPYNEAITIIPSLVDPADYMVRRHEQAQSLTLGWIGSPTTARYLHDLGPTLERFASQSSRPVRLVVVGGRAPALSHIESQELAWSRDAERSALAKMDIGLMPLQNTPWSRGKCAYKALQYMASGIPPVVDDVGISARVVDGAGFASRTEAGWLEALHSLAEDVDQRVTLGTAGRERIEKEFSIDHWVPTIAKILRGV